MHLSPKIVLCSPFFAIGRYYTKKSLKMKRGASSGNRTHNLFLIPDVSCRLSRQWESNPRPLSYQESVLPLNYVGLEQRDPVFLSHFIKIGKTILGPRKRSATELSRLVALYPRAFIQIKSEFWLFAWRSSSKSFGFWAQNCKAILKRKIRL